MFNPYEHTARDGLDPPEVETCRHDRPVDDCDACAEALWEASCDRFYGGSVPVTVGEQYQQAAMKRRQG